jgi:hypothetical protein
MPSKVNVSVPEDEVPMMAIFDGAEGSPLESIAQIATRSVALAGSDPPVADCEIDPIPGAPAPVALNSLTGSFPVNGDGGRTSQRRDAVRGGPGSFYCNGGGNGLFAVRTNAN